MSKESEVILMISNTGEVLHGARLVARGNLTEILPLGISNARTPERGEAYTIKVYEEVELSREIVAESADPDPKVAFGYFVCGMHRRSGE